MIRSNAVLAVVFGVALAGCQRAPEQAAASPSPSAPMTTLATGPLPGEPAPYSLAPTAPPAAPAGPAYEAPRAERAAPPRAPSTRGTTARRSDRVDRAPAAEPIDIPAEEARREPAAAPMTSAREVNRERMSIPAGTELQLVLESDLSSATANEGDPVTARVSRATSPDGNVLLPGGTVLKGRVYRADAAGRVKGRSRLSVDFDRIVVRGVEHRLDTTAIDVEGPDSHGRDAAIIGGSTVGGAIVGGILGGGSGAKKGAVVGAVGGTGAVLATRGKDVVIPSGSRWTVRVKDRVAL
jgi:type IV secretory pathway VirB10-like protein